MQAQGVRTDQSQAVITSQQSLQSIQTLLRAGLGCITYLRNLLPADNFSTSYLTSSGPESLSSEPSGTPGSSFSPNGCRNVSGFRIMTITRGFTEEADKLLNLLETGIFDAIQKQYLRCFIFAVYLDDNDPNNIVEAYTFNFTYCTVPGTTETVPIMTLGEEMASMSLSGERREHDAVAEATKKGKIPTLGEVKRSLKALIKILIQTTTQMDTLPKRRFATFKLFYHDNTPDDYEPPHFRPADSKKDKWVMTTHHQGEVPDRYSVGCVQTGYHGVDVKITSVANYLPSVEDNNAPFLGTTEKNPFANRALTPAEDAALRAQQIETQRRDADDRCVVWDGDNVQDAACENATGDSGQVLLVGIRDESGLVVPLSSQREEVPETPEGQYAGRPEEVPMCIGHLVTRNLSRGQELSPTQELQGTQDAFSPHARATSSHSRASTLTPVPPSRSRSYSAHMDSSLPPSDISSSVSFERGAETIPTQLLKDMILTANPASCEDSMMLDMETQQPVVSPNEEDSIQSFSESCPPTVLEIPEASMAESDVLEKQMDCLCGVQREDCDIICCDDHCGKWFHLWCMGFHSSQDPRLPAEFICFDCRVKADPNWDMISAYDLYPQMIDRYQNLAIHRRGIKVFETHGPDTTAAFTKLIGCDPAVAGQTLKRLETEGFVAQEIRVSDNSEFMETTELSSKKKTKGKSGARSKAKATSRRKNMQKPVFVFVLAAKNNDAYKDYFNPEPATEKRILKFHELKPKREGRKKKHTTRVNPAEPNGITPGQVLPGVGGSQDEGSRQLLEGRLRDMKRKSGSDDIDARGKKIKVSLGPAVDLGD